MERRTVAGLGAAVADEADGIAREIPDWWDYGPAFPRWHVWLGVNGMFYARVPGVSPERLVRARTVEDLRHGIVRVQLSRWAIPSKAALPDHCA
jgi:hypothetical protein